MNDVAPRFEFRAFAQTFGLVAERIRRRAKCDDITESVEHYLIAPAIDDLNVKIRGGKIDVKRLVERRAGLERWEPAGEEPFPVSRDFVRELFARLRLQGADRLTRPQYGGEELLSELVSPGIPLWPARVFKRRFRFTVEACPVEMDEVSINGGAIRSAAVESTDAELVSTLLREFGLDDYENVNYPRAIRRVMGFEPWPQGADCRE